MGIANGYKALNAQLGITEKLIEVEESRNRYQRDLFLKLSATLLTLVFGFNGAKQVVDTVSAWSPLPTNQSPVWIADLFNSIVLWVHGHPIRVTIGLYLVLACSVLVTMIWSLVPRGRRRAIITLDQSSPALSPGFSWPKTLNLEVREMGSQDRREQSSE